MLPETIEQIIQERIRKIEAKPDGSFEKERNLEGVRLLRQASERSRDPYNDRNEIYHLLSRGLTLFYYEQKY